MGYRRTPRLSGGERVAGCGRSKGGVGVQLCKQAGGWNLQSMRKADQRKHRNIVPPQFNLAEIPVPYARSSGEGLLGQAALLPVLTEGRPKALQRCVLRVGRGRSRVAVCHRRIPSFLRVQGPQGGQRRYGTEGGFFVR